MAHIPYKNNSKVLSKCRYVNFNELIGLDPDPHGLGKKSHKARKPM